MFQKRWRSDSMNPKENLFGRSISPVSKLVFPLSSKLLPYLEDPSAHLQDDSPNKEWLFNCSDNSLESKTITALKEMLLTIQWWIKYFKDLGETSELL